MNSIVDFHSHVLPNMDDGSGSVEESIQLLKALRSQNVGTVLATPHFYANELDVQSFLIRRKNAYNVLNQRIISDTSFPSIILGAEVKYFPGISRMKELSELRIEGTRLLLLEMPFLKWNDSILTELAELSSYSDTIVMLAHIERYFPYNSPSRIFALSEERDILTQSNAEYFVDKKSRRKALKLLSQNRIDCIGSDCHNIHIRPPQLGEANAVVEKYLGTDFLNRFQEKNRRILFSSFEEQLDD